MTITFVVELLELLSFSNHAVTTNQPIEVTILISEIVLFVLTNSLLDVVVR